MRSRRVIVAGLAVFAVVYVGFGFAASSRWVWPLFLLYGLYQGLTDGTSRAYIAGITPPISAAPRWVPMR